MSTSARPPNPALEASLAAIIVPLNEAEQQLRTDALKAAKPPSKLGVEKLTPEEQKRRFEYLARELECGVSKENFDAALRVIVKQKPKES